jgi:hypothetical protein
MCGRRADFLRVIHVGRHLTGEASDWYEYNVYSIERDTNVRWTFLEVIRRLFKAFIDESALQLAVQSYYRVRYSEDKGVHSYIRELKKKANRLTSKPDEFTFRERFVDGLPERLVEKMIDRYDITAESSTIDQMTAAIRKVEKSTIYRKRVRERRAHRSNGSPSPKSRDKEDRLGADYYHRKSRSRERRRSHRKERREGKRDRNRPARDDVRRERKFEPTKERDRDRGKGKGPNPNVTCFACQQKGHYASDPACPMYGKRDKPALRDRPQVRAARAGKEEDQSSEEDADAHLEDGSQYSSSSTEESATSGSESSTPTTETSSDDSRMSRERPQVRRLNAEDHVEGEDMKYIRAVRAKVAPAIEEHPARASLNRKMDRPKRSKREETCLAGWIRINDVDAFTLFDSGSNMDTISPTFAQVSKIPTQKLEQQVPLQLGTVGSRAAINYGAQVPIELGDIQHPKYYFDIVNIDRYDCIAGAPMMRQFGIRLDFRDDAIYVGERRIQALLPDEEAAILRGRQPPKARPN